MHKDENLICSVYIRDVIWSIDNGLAIIKITFLFFMFRLIIRFAAGNPVSISDHAIRRSSC